MRKSENKERGKEGSKLRQERSSFVSLEDEKTWKDKKETKTRGGGRKKEKERERENEKREKMTKGVLSHGKEANLFLSRANLFLLAKKKKFFKESQKLTHTQREKLTTMTRSTKHLNNDHKRLWRVQKLK